LRADLADAIERSRERLGRIGSRILHFDSIGSTNDVAASLAANGDSEGMVVTADEQSAGRGRRGRIWYSPPASGLYVSVVLTPRRARSDPERATKLVTLSAGVALAEAIERLTALRVDIKWPNDLHISRRKLAGILAEGVGSTIQSVVLGYGINVGPKSHPPELGDRATSLETELGRPIDRAALFGETLVAISRRYDDLLGGRFDAILDAWRARAPRNRGAKVSWTTASGERYGTTAGIDGGGALLVRVGDRIERIVAGELTWL
jgi:BirA family biotin operon repressor/biotin-[acetyl-CoA-carboxylase] ligase